MDEDKVTVVVAVYNIENYISDCIESITCQTYKNLQIILVDDGSFDSSGKICDEFAQKDKRIEVVHQLNGGLSEARNTGIRKAEGKWIAFIDGDDYIHPQFIEILYKAVKESESKIAICDYTKVKECKTVFDKYTYNYHSTVLSSEQMLQNWHGKLTKIETVAWNKLYDINLFQEIRYPKGRIHEDIYITHHLIAGAKKIVIIPTRLYFYTQRNDSIIGSKLSEEHIVQNLQAQRERLTFFNQYHYSVAHMQLKIGMVKYIIFYYVRVLFRINIQITSYKGIKKYLRNEFLIMLKDDKNA